MERLNLMNREILDHLRKIPAGDALKAKLASYSGPKLINFVTELSLLTALTNGVNPEDFSETVKKAVSSRVEIGMGIIKRRGLMHQFMSHVSQKHKEACNRG